MVSKEINIAFRLGKDQRLKSRKLIGTLFQEGKQVTFHPIRAIYQLTSTPVILQAGFTASSKNFKRAVDRNRLKRLMRESYRLQKNELENFLKSKGLHLIVFFIYTGKELEEFSTISAKMKSVIEGLQKKIIETTSAGL